MGMDISKPLATGARAVRRDLVPIIGLPINAPPAKVWNAAVTQRATTSAMPILSSDPRTAIDAAKLRSANVAAISGQSNHGLARTVSHAPNAAATAASSQDSTRRRPPTSTRTSVADATANDAPRPKAPTRKAWSANRPTTKAEARAIHVDRARSLRFTQAGKRKCVGVQVVPSQRHLRSGDSCPIYLAASSDITHSN